MEGGLLFSVQLLLKMSLCVCVCVQLCPVNAGVRVMAVL
jgi:hypothetical protein